MSYKNEKMKFSKYNSESDNLLRNISKEIVYELWSKYKFNVDNSLILLLTRLLCLNPKYGIDSDSKRNRITIDCLIKKSLELLSDSNSILMTILQMQNLFIQNSIDKERIIETYRNQLAVKTQVLTEDIVGSAIASSRSYENYFRKVTVDIIVQQSLGDPSQKEVIEQTLNALKSVMSQSDILSFSKLPEKQKLESLVALRQIVCGIRIFNKDAGHCGEGIVDIEEILHSGYKATKQQLNISLDEIQQHINLLTKTLKKCTMFSSSASNYNEIKNNVINETEIDRLKDLLIMYRQCEQFIIELLRNTCEQKHDIDRLLKSFRNQLNCIHEVLKCRIAVPMATIFPKFIELAKLWQQLQNQLYVLSEINSINEKLMIMSENTIQWNKICYKINECEGLRGVKYLGFNEDNVTDNEESDDGDEIDNAQLSGKFNNHNAIDLITNNELLSVVQYEAELTVEYEAYCAWSLAFEKGLLIPAKLSIGLIKYRDKLYAFRSITAAERFQQNPETCLTKLIEVAKEKIQLIILLDLFDEINEAKSKELSFTATEMTVATKSKSIEVQTEIHPIPYYKDRNYSCNVWDLQRKAIQLANLKNYRTKSTQTKESCYRFEFGTQTWDKQNNNCQTNINKSTQL